MKKKTYKIINSQTKKEWERKKKEWKTNARFWIKIISEKLDPFRLELTNAAVLEHFKGKKSLTVLDAGCGEGYLCRALAKMGHKAYGIDFNEALIEAAKNQENKNPQGIRYSLGDLKKLPYPNSFFDAILANHAVNELDDPKKAFQEFRRVLKPKGRAVMLFLHPCFDLNPGDLKNNFVSRYFQKIKVTRECFIVSGIRSPSSYFYLHLPLSQWIKLLTNAGFLIEAIKEPNPARGVMQKSKWWKENFKKPLFILIQAVKI